MVSGASVDFMQQLLPVNSGSGDVLTRFAPSPNGQLHLGHAFSALCAHDFARAHGGKFRLRIEDIDGTRSRPEHINGILADMRWLGLEWDGDVQFQSAHVVRYQAALDRLRGMGLVYRCACTRTDIAEAIKLRPVPHGPDGPVYPGTCRHRGIDEGRPHNWRLDMEKAFSVVGALTWIDLAAGIQSCDPPCFGDVVLWRKDAPASYHLAATVDDAADHISHVVRGRDLFAYTAIHRLLQVLLDLPEPVYWHHPLFMDGRGEKLAKSRSSPSLSALREAEEDGAAVIDALRRGDVPLGISLSRA